MLIGSGLMRSGWLKGAFRVSHYRKVAAVLLPLSLLIQIPAIYLQYRTGWDYRWSGFLLQVPREIGSLMQAVSYLALCYGFWPLISRWRITHWISQTGRMALTNYLLQTLICITFFNVFGFYQHFDRLQLVALVPLVWVCNVLVTLLWLRHFRQGPVEWLWRQLTAKAAGEELKAA